MKRGVFFSTDAIIALGIILLVVLIAYPLIENTKRDSEIQYDVLNTLSALRTSEINDPYVRSLISQGVITDANKSILETIGELYVTNRSIAETIASNVINNVDTPSDVGIWYGSTLLASKNNTPYEEAKSVETARQLISGIREGGSVTGFSARAYLAGDTRKKYSYFGGYVGDGPIKLNIEINGTVYDAELEIATNSDFQVYVNNQLAGSYDASPSQFTPSSYSIPTTSFINGTNEIELRAGNFSVSGGLLKITHESDAVYESATTHFLPGIDGIINLYDGLTIPGDLETLDVYLHYETNYSLFLTIGNTTLFNSTSNGESYTSIPDASARTVLDYNTLSNKTTPFRLGLQNVSLTGSNQPNIDVVLITDTSGSMAWRLNTDSTGTDRACDDPLLYSSSTSRISLARCLDQSFADTILNSSSNSRIALVAFSDSSNSYTSLTRDENTISSTIGNYTASGSTCISCAINRAYDILNSESGSDRIKYIIVMTDGVANRRSTGQCYDMRGTATQSSNIFSAGASGTILSKQSSAWNSINSPTTTQINDVELTSSTDGFAVGSSGLILRWNGASWSSMASPLTQNLNHLEIYNSTRALSAGASGRVIRWDGSSWSSLATVHNSATLNAISFANNTLIFTAGERSSSGRIYRSLNGGTSWSEIYQDGTRFRGLDMFNSTFGFAVGDNGLIVRWNGTGWSTVNSATTEDLYSVSIYNSTHALAVGGDNGKSRVMRWNGASWSSQLNAAADSLKDVEISSTTYAAGDGATIYEYTSGTWQRQFSIPIAYMGNSTSGVTCTSDEDSCSETQSFPALNANYSSCRARNDLDATIYSIGFGPVESCSFASTTLQAIASCGNGSYYSSSDADTLQQFYQTIAQEIIQVSYYEQTAETSGGINTKLYPDSYIRFGYSSQSNPYGLYLTLEKQFDDDTSLNFTIPQNTTLLEAHAVSYSGPKWTSWITLNNNPVYNLTQYGQDFTKLGDPFRIMLPLQYIEDSNLLTLFTGLSPSNSSAGSSSNKIIYTVVKNASGYSPIAARADGCTWTIAFDGGSNITLTLPPSYSGPDICEYSQSSQTYDENDALQTATFRLLQNLDLDHNNLVDLELTENDIDIALSELTGIPYSWSTEVQVRTWR